MELGSQSPFHKTIEINAAPPFIDDVYEEEKRTVERRKWAISLRTRCSGT